MASPTRAPTQYRQISLRVMVLWAFLPLAPVAIAQSAINSGASDTVFPLRNLTIEMRQVALDQQAQSSGHVEAGLVFRQDTGTQSASTTQQVLVLNGRVGTLYLRTTTPYRLAQTVWRAGQPLLVSGSVLVNATTGFQATPRWAGGEQVELELAAQQAVPAPGNAVARSQATTTTVVLPLGEWTTVAESEQAQAEQRSGLAGAGDRTRTAASVLQARVSLR